mmetsp:Transcript_20406/g.62869  ORF Transcript_20406/g.62869 Transcript_20406/m.62869 type:complete len:227 (+) Transcript_20406:363-1043(+)
MVSEVPEGTPAVRSGPLDRLPRRYVGARPVSRLRGGQPGQGPHFLRRAYRGAALQAGVHAELGPELLGRGGARVRQGRGPGPLLGQRDGPRPRRRRVPGGIPGRRQQAIRSHEQNCLPRRQPQRHGPGASQSHGLRRPRPVALHGHSLRPGAGIHGRARRQTGAPRLEERRRRLRAALGRAARGARAPVRPRRRPRRVELDQADAHDRRARRDRGASRARGEVIIK